MSITVQLAHFSDCHSHFDGAPMSFSRSVKASGAPSAAVMPGS